LHKLRIGFVIFGIVAVSLLGLFGPRPLTVQAQQPTGSIPTVTGTPAGPTIRVDSSLQKVLVYAGPSSFDYPAIGVLLGNETAPALGIADGKPDWIQIYYPGVPNSVAWVWALQVSLSPGALLLPIEIPATPTPLSTPTINPTLEAAFIGLETATRLPTFTEAPPLEIPQFQDETTNATTGVPAGLLIVALGLFGFFGAVISYLRGR
jgi:hypothetical protein